MPINPIYFTFMFMNLNIFRKKPPLPLKKVLFIVKKRTLPFYASDGNVYNTSTGLKNSAAFIQKALNDRTSNVTAVLEEAIDNNDIDRLVTKHRPDVVIIEALWVIPSKFEILQRLHPNVKWIVRLHSNIPFLATEGSAFEWLNQYLYYQNVYISTNHKKIVDELRHLYYTNRILYQPNYYDTSAAKLQILQKHYSDYINIGCFGAIRPLKNQLLQAIAAIRFADKNGYILNFHINGTRVEGNGDPILKNMRALFASTEHMLIEHQWSEHDNFVETMGTLDIHMQVSMSETYNIVTCDAVVCGIPVVVSKEVDWIHHYAQADTTDSEDMAMVIERVWKGRFKNLQKRNLVNLMELNDKAIVAWQESLL